MSKKKPSDRNTCGRGLLATSIHSQRERELAFVRAAAVERIYPNREVQEGARRNGTRKRDRECVGARLARLHHVNRGLEHGRQVHTRLVDRDPEARAGHSAAPLGTFSAAHWARASEHVALIAALRGGASAQLRRAGARGRLALRLAWVGDALVRYCNVALLLDANLICGAPRIVLPATA